MKRLFYFALVFSAVLSTIFFSVERAFAAPTFIPNCIFGTVGTPVTFDVAAQFETGGNAYVTVVEWGDGTSPSSNGAPQQTKTFSHTWNAPGTYTISALHNSGQVLQFRNYQTSELMGVWDIQDRKVYCKVVIEGTAPPPPPPPSPGTLVASCSASSPSVSANQSVTWTVTVAEQPTEYRWQRFETCQPNALPNANWSSCPFSFFEQPQGEWGAVCTNPNPPTTHNCQVNVPPGYGCNQTGTQYNRYSCNAYSTPPPTYAYSWSGTDSLSGSTQTVSKSYAAAGTKTATVAVTASDGRTATVNCTVSVTGTPDLTVTNAVTGPYTLIAGQTATYAGVIENKGNSTASNFQNIININPSNLALPAGTLSLSPNNLGAVQASHTFSVPGTYQVRACADANQNFAGTISESNEANNCGPWTTVTVIAPLSASCSVSPSTAVTNQQVTWTATASGGVGNYTYSWEGTDSLSGTSASVSKTYSTTGVKNGTVYVNSGGQTVQVSCSNSVSIGVPPAPNLVAGAVTGPTSLVAGTAATYSSTITNSGNASTGAGFTNILQIDNDSNHATVDVTMTDTSPAIPMNGTDSTQFTRSFSTAGTKYLRVCADQTDTASGVIAESNENDNCGPWTTVTVIAPLSASCSVSPSTAVTNQQVTWTATASGGVGNYTYSWEGTDSLSGMSASVSKTYSTTGVKNGTVYVNSGGQTVQVSCSNSVSIGVPPAPNLVAAGVSASPTITAGVVLVNTSVTLSGIITNSGNASTGASFPNLFQVDGDADHNTVTASNIASAPALAQLGTYTASIQHTFPSKGVWYVRICADSNNNQTSTIAESNENDNCGPWTQLTVAAVPTADLTASASSVPAGSTATLTWTSTDATSCTGTNFTAGGTSGSASVTVNANTTYSISCTGAGGSATDSVTITAIYQCSNGIDDDGDGRVDLADFGCSNASDNSESPDPPMPDVIVGAVSPTAVTVNQQVSLSAVVTNQGTLTTGNSFTNLFQIDADADHAAVTTTRTDTSPALTPQGNDTTSVPHTFTTSGTWYVRVCTDKSSISDPGTITESNENNNCGEWTTITVAALPHCSNGIDDDGDGAVDYPADPGCQSTGDNDETNAPPAQCSNGIDDDGDGKTDAADPGCTDGNDNTESPDPTFPDLVADPTAISPANPLPNAPINFTSTIRNAGNGNSTSFPNVFQVANAARTVTVAVVPGQNLTLSAAGGGSAAGAISAYHPLAAGTYSVRACADSSTGPGTGGNQNESNENNNCGEWFDFTVAAPPPPPQCSDTINNDSDAWTDYPADPGCTSATDTTESPNPQCSDGIDNDTDGVIDYPDEPGCTSISDNDETDPPKPDLTADPTTIAPTVPVTSAPTQFSSRVRNVGNGNSTSFPNLFQVTDAAKTQTVALVAAQNRTVSQGGSATLSASRTLAKGDYSVRACADSSTGPGTGGNQNESNENNNCGEWTNFSVADALVVSCSVSPSTAVLNQEVVWSANATGGNGTYTYVWSGTDGLSGTLSSVTKSYSTAGSKTASVSVSSGGQTVARSCSNSVSVGIPPAPNLTAGDVSPKSATLNVPVTLSATITNNGALATGAGFMNLYQSATTMHGANAADIGTWERTTALNTGDSTTSTFEYTFTTAGPWYVRVCADKDSASDSGDIAESDEDNNCGEWTRITIGTPNQCADGIDNDGDSWTDYPADPGCFSDTDNTESPNPECSNLLDDEGDGFIDLLDPECHTDGDPGNAASYDPRLTEGEPPPPPQCSDGIDNDGNGQTDYPNDSGCDGPADLTEETPNPDLAVATLDGKNRVDSGTSANLNWTAQYVVPGSCRITGTNGDSFVLTGTSGSVTTSALFQQTNFTLSCVSVRTGQSFSILVTIRINPNFGEE